MNFTLKENDYLLRGFKLFIVVIIFAVIFNLII